MSRTVFRSSKDGRDARLERVTEMYSSGMSFRQISAALGISHYRLEQIVAPRRSDAREAVRYALKTGTLVRPSACESCLLSVRTHAHHEDYDKPLDIKWLCTKCHAKAHKGRWDRKSSSSPTEWEAYRYSRPKRVCEMCGAEFTRGTKVTTCSEKCAWARKDKYKPLYQARHVLRTGGHKAETIDKARAVLAMYGEESIGPAYARKELPPAEATMEPKPIV